MINIGIYKIWFEDPNKIYIGSTINDFGKRQAQHLYLLRNNKHTNDHLQNSFNKYSEANFNFEPIEGILIRDITYVTKRETYWYYEFPKQGYKLYNCHPPEESPMFGRHPSKKTLEKMSKARKGIKCPDHSERMKGNKNSLGYKHTEEQKLNNAIAQGAKPFYVLKDNIVIAEYINQVKCARDFNLDSTNLCACLHKRRKVHKGYTFKYTEIKIW